MVKTRTEIKVKIGEWIDKRQEPFSTQKVKEGLDLHPCNIHLAPNRLAKFIQATGKADYDNSKRLWSKRQRVEVENSATKK